uniref:Uncharacterized protein n=1 Tax=Callorhinchus milii TaxID=7868 RepID=A0A4W3J7Y7_CALMI
VKHLPESVVFFLYSVCLSVAVGQNCECHRPGSKHPASTMMNLIIRAQYESRVSPALIITLVSQQAKLQLVILRLSDHANCGSMLLMTHNTFGERTYEQGL